MTDQIVEFCNAVVGKAELEAGFDIVANGVGDTAIVREVSITSKDALPFSLDIDGTVVASVTGSAVLAGSEVVMPEKSLSLTADTSWLMNGIDYFYNDYVPYKSTTLFGKPDGATLAMSAAAAAVSFSGLSTGLYFACFDASGNFYYATPSSPTLYKRAGGVNGTETTYALGTCQVYDGSRYIYAVNSAVLKRFDTQTGTIDGSGGASGFGDSYGRIATIDGFMILRMDYTGGTYKVGNPVAGTVVGFAGAGDGSAQRYFLQIGRRTDGDYIVVTTTSSAFYWYNLGSNLASPAVKASGTIATSLDVYAGHWNQIFRHPNDPSKLFLLHYNGYREFDLDTLAWSEKVSITGVPGSSYSVMPRFDAAAALADFSPVRVRATGILCTEAA